MHKYDLRGLLVTTFAQIYIFASHVFIESAVIADIEKIVLNNEIAGRTATGHA